MNRFVLSACVILLSLYLSRAADPAAARKLPPATEKFSIENDITFADLGKEKLQLDFAVPKSAGPHPCVVCLHGGAWRFGSRKDLSRPNSMMDFGESGKSLLEMLAARGYAAASVSYRLAPQSKFPAQIEDAKTAVRFLRANAKKYNIDPERIAAMGFSAGGHLAALLGTTDATAGFEGKLYPEQSSRVRCVVDYFGPADLTLYAETPAVEKAFMLPLLGASATENLDIYKRASPIQHVTKDDPPFLILQGTADFIVPAIHSERFHEKLKTTGVKSDLILVKGKGHGWSGEESLNTSIAVSQFLQQNLRDK